jgi:ATP-dependent exoDNAse (exonuclease V) alpha subunit
MVVIPFWDEIERFNQEARPALRRVGLLGQEEVIRESVRPLTWTDEQKIHWAQYKIGDRLLFVRDSRFFKRGVAAEVVEVLNNGIRVRSAKGRVAKITRKQRAAFDVGRVQKLAVSVGDRILIRGRDDDAGFSNGDFREVERVDPGADKIILKGGGELPREFAAWTYGHALTSYRSQGSTSEESILVLGQVAARSIARRQFYVANTRYRGAHAIYLSDKHAIMRRLGGHVDDRELATEFVQRNNIVMNERLYPRPIRRLRAHLRVAWLAMVEKLHLGKSRGERMSA